MAENKLNADDVCRRALETYGVPAQIEMTQEECAELIAAIDRHRRGRCPPEQVAEEIADVEIMCRQMRMLYPGVDEFVEHKLQRLDERVREVQELGKR